MKCDGDPDEIIEGRKSFPSGHASCKLQSEMYILFFNLEDFEVGGGEGGGGGGGGEELLTIYK